MSRTAESLLGPLQTLRAAQLRRLALSCGVAVTGTRPVLSQRIADALNQVPPVSATDRVLSIDMGIRNLAFCLLTPNSEVRLPHAAKERSSGRASTAAAASSVAPSLHAWKVLDLAAAGDDDCLSSSQGLSGLAVRLVLDHVLPLRPTHVLIERQRWRSGGNAAVLQWTVRVNSLEAMLLAIMATLRSQGLWDGAVESVDPARAAPFFFPDGDTARAAPQKKTRRGMSKGKRKDAAVEDGEEELGEPAAAETGTGTVDDVASGKAGSGGRIEAKRLKKMKIDLLGSWLQDQRQTQLRPQGPEVQKLAASFLEKWHGGRRQLAAADREFKKLDDLSDCVIQGMAWLRWQENKARLLEEGPEPFLERLDK